MTEGQTDATFPEAQGFCDNRMKMCKAQVVEHCAEAHRKALDAASLINAAEEEEAATQAATEAAVADAVSENIVEESYEIKDGDEIIAARDMANAVNYDLIILIVLVVALIGGAVFFFLKQRQGHQQVPTSDPEEQKEEEAAAETPAEKETIVAENQE